MLIHATAIAIGNRAVLLTGASGRGKSDLAMRLIDRGAVLIADDQVRLAVADGVLTASAPPTIAGRFELRGVGIIELPWTDEVPIALIADLDAVPERLPEPEWRDLLGLQVQVIALAAFEASAPLKIEQALRGAATGVDSAR